MTRIVDDSKVYVVTVGPSYPDLLGGGGTIDDSVVANDSTFSSEKIMELLYPFAIQSFSVSPSIAEIGSSVTALNFNWVTNHAPGSVSISPLVGAVALPATSCVLQTTLTSNTTFILTAIKGAATKTAQATVSFLNRVYWGVNETQTSESVVIQQMSSALSGNRARSLTFDCSGGKFFHLAYPSRLGDASFKINNLTYSDMTKVTVQIENEFGYSELYNVYFCNVVQHGSAITLVVQ